MTLKYSAILIAWQNDIILPIQNCSVNCRVMEKVFCLCLDGCESVQSSRVACRDNLWLLPMDPNGEGKRRNEFAEWHVAWLAEWHNYAECKIWKLAQRNKLNWKACARHCRAFFGANLSEQLLHWFTHLGIYLKHTWELARVPEGSVQTKTLKSGKYSEAWPK